MSNAEALAGSAETVTVAWNPNPESDIAGYRIHIGTSSGEYTRILEVGNVTTAELPDLYAGTTYYCALQAYNTAGLASDLTPEISFSISSVASGFHHWAVDGGLTGSDTLPLATPYDDGVPNLLKFAFNMNASGPDTRILAKGAGMAGLPNFGIERDETGTWFAVEYLRRKSGGLVYTPETSNDLATYVPMSGNTAVTDVDNTWERVVVRMRCDPDAMPKLFGRVVVTQP